MINHEKIVATRYKKFTIVTILYLCIFGTIHYFKGDVFNVYLDFTMAFAAFINLILKHSLKYKIANFIIIGIILLVVFLYNENTHYTGWLWYLVFPSFSFLLNDKKDGIRWTFIPGSILLLNIVLQFFNIVTTEYTNYELFVLLSVYIIIVNLMYIFQKEVDFYNYNLQELNTLLEIKVQEGIKENREKDNILNIQSKQAQMGEMVSMIAHQWRQPLNAISASAIRLHLENDMNLLNQEKINEMSDFIQTKTQDMSEIIDSFLEFSKPISKSEYFDVENAIQKVLTIVETQFILHSIDIEIVYDEKYKREDVYGSQNLLEQVVLNLLINTRDAFETLESTQKKVIYIILKDTGNIQIVDNAGGMTSEVQEKIFNPYFTTKEEGKGTGIGLYMSRKIMKINFQGDLLYEPLEQGSCFNIVFKNHLEKDSQNV